MSKVSFSRELLGTIRFVFDKTKSRNLNATQAYDKSPSQIVLGSFLATASKKLLTKDARFFTGVASVNVTAAGPLDPGAPVSEVLGKSDIVIPSAIDLSFGAGIGRQRTTKYDADTAGFSGLGNFVNNDAIKSNATKDIFYGAITVGTGEYKEWQGKYAVLKVDLLTNNAILRVYNR